MYSQALRQEILDYYKTHTAPECREMYGINEYSIYGWTKILGIQKNGPPRIQPPRDKEDNPAWKGGRTNRVERSIRILIGKKEYRDEHVLIADKILGRKLKRGEVVHHIDFDTQNNRNDNLLICTRSFHIWLHRKIDIKNGVNHFKGMRSPYQKAA